MKQILVFLLAVLLLLGGCGQVAEQSPAPVSPTATPAPTPKPVPAPESTPTLDENGFPLAGVTLEEAARLYLAFLRDEVPEYVGDDYEDWISFRYDIHQVQQILTMRDLTGDGIPELCSDGAGVCYTRTIQNGKIVQLAYTGTYWTILPNGGLFYHRPGGAPSHDDYSYQALSPESRAYEDVYLSIYDMDQDGEFDTYFLNDEEVSQEKWQAVADMYFALRDAEPVEEISFADWFASLEIEAPPPLPLTEEMACRSYLSFVCGREQYAPDGTRWYWHYDHSFKDFSVYDFDGDGFMELFLTENSDDIWTISDYRIVWFGSLAELGKPPEAMNFFDWTKRVSP